MPTYEYSCGTDDCPVVEERRAMKDRDAPCADCECGKPRKRRLASPPVHLKGDTFVGGSWQR